MVTSSARLLIQSHWADMQATESIAWLDSPHALDETVQRLADIKSIGLDAGLYVDLSSLSSFLVRCKHGSENVS